MGAFDLMYVSNNEKSHMSFLSADALSGFRFINLTAPSNDAVTKRYVFSPTDRIINLLSSMGWGVIEVKEQKKKDLSRTGRTEAIGSFHMVIFQNNHCAILDNKGNVDAFPRIILTTSHDGKHAFKMHIGIFRIVCSNGLVVATTDLGGGRICHKGEDAKNLESIVKAMVELAEKQVILINKLRSLTMTEDEITEFAFDCLKAVKGEKYDFLTREQYDGIIESRRDEDDGNDMWVVFNRIQENLIKGGYQLPSLGKKKGNGKPRVQRPIVGAEKDFNANLALWNTLMTWAKRVEERMTTENQPKPKLLRDANGRFIKRTQPTDIEVVEVLEYPCE